MARPATLALRCAAWTVDGLLIVLVGASIAASEILLLQPKWQARVIGLLDFLAAWAVSHRSALTHGLLGAGVFASLYVLVTSWRGMCTLGGFLTRTRVVRSDGAPPGRSVMLLRAALGVFSGVVMGAGWAWALVDARQRTWHDIATRTLVVRVD